MFLTHRKLRRHVLLGAPQPAGQPFYFKGDHNWTPYGAERSARLVAQTLKGNDVLKALPHQTFTSQTAGLLGRSGTLQKAAAHLQAKGARSVRTCVLLDKPSRRVVPFEADFVGFRIEDAFVVGYGLDYDGRHRELPHIAKVTFTGPADTP